MLRPRRVILVTVIVMLAVIAAAFVLPPTKWRLRVLALKQQGALDEVGWVELMKMLGPGSPYYLQPLLATPSLYQTVRNPFKSRKAVDRGAKLFAQKCASCHGVEGIGNTAPSLVKGPYQSGASDWGVFRAITKGIAGTPMITQRLSEREAWSLVAYVQARRMAERGAVDTTAATVDFPALRTLNVPFDDLRRASELSDWLTYSGSYSSQRFSLLKQIDRGNVGKLTIKWVFQIPTSLTILETTPLARDGVLIFTGGKGEVTAVDAVTGTELWNFTPEVAGDVPLCCGPVNRGAAILDTRIFVTTLDARLIALDVKSGSVLWNVPVADYHDGYSITSAPLALNNLVLTGVAGGEFGIRGFVAAFDARTGKRVWQFNTIPDPGQPGHETWQGKSWQNGGAPTWLTGSYDPDLGLVYWSIGNPGPVYDGSNRAGDNLYTNSVVALDAATGRLKWHFQFTPHDEHDWDANQIPVLADVAHADRSPKRVFMANKNGFFYSLDRETGAFITAAPFVTQTWAKGIDAKGRPISRVEATPTPQGTFIHPGTGGGTNWWSPAFNPELNLFYVPALESASVFYRTPETFRRGSRYLGGAGVETKGEPGWFALRAIDALTGKRVWEYRPQPSRAPRTGGLLATSGGLLFGGHAQSFFALDAATGAELWKIHIGGPIGAAPITYNIDGKQYITIAAAKAIITFTLPE